MEIQTPTEKLHDISFNDSSFAELEEYLAANIDKEGHHLSLFLGGYSPNKKKALDQLSSRLNREVKVINTENYVTKSESETFRRLDSLFEGLDQTNVILYFENGAKLCGTYTGNSRSYVKYATPQERYFLKLVKDFDGLVIIDIEDYSDADATLRRASKSVISFTLPSSKLTRFWWHLKNFSPHGYDIRSKRPEAYDQEPVPRR
jgi:hypothetical protein